MNAQELKECINFRQKVIDLINGFHEEVKKTFNGINYCLPKITDENEVAYRLWENVGNIKDFNSRRGYVVLQDNTIICVSSSSYIAQFDGCKESEICYQVIG